MPYRTFKDSTGTDWQVWDIVPQLNERRSDEATERRLSDVEVPFTNRRYDERRVADTRRAILRGSYSQGWLCFESLRGKRRLSPIPDDWLTCSDPQLERYYRDGERVSGAQRMVQDFSADNPLAEAG